MEGFKLPDNNENLISLESEDRKHLILLFEKLQNTLDANRIAKMLYEDSNVFSEHDIRLSVSVGALVIAMIKKLLAEESVSLDEIKLEELINYDTGLEEEDRGRVMEMAKNRFKNIIQSVKDRDFVDILSDLDLEELETEEDDNIDAKSIPNNVIDDLVLNFSISGDDEEDKEVISNISRSPEFMVLKKDKLKLALKIFGYIIHSIDYYHDEGNLSVIDKEDISQVFQEREELYDKHTVNYIVGQVFQVVKRIISEKTKELS